jgi:hypothetical protein
MDNFLTRLIQTARRSDAAHTHTESLAATDVTTDDGTDAIASPAQVMADLARANDWTHEELDHLATEHPHLRAQIEAARDRIDDCEARGVLLLPDSQVRPVTVDEATDFLLDRHHGDVDET